MRDKLTRENSLRIKLLAGCFIVCFCAAGTALPGQAVNVTPSSDSGTSAAAQTVAITLEEAIHRAEATQPEFAAAVAQSKTSSLDRSIARNGLLPSVVYHNQALYTQANGLQNQAGQGVTSQPAPRFIANNAVREYASQGSINETLGLAGVAGLRRADAAQVQAAAELEVSRRGLVAAVTGLFYGSLAADHKLTVAERAHLEAVEFTKLTSEREEAREAAHADVVKAQLEEQQRERDLSDAQVNAEKARLELGVLLFPDPRTAFTLQAADTVPPLASRQDV